MIWGVVIDGRLAHVASSGVRERSSGDKIAQRHRIPHRVDDEELYGAGHP